MIPQNLNEETDGAVAQERLVLLLNEAYVFLGMPHKALHPWRIALDEWQAKVEQETGWSHFDEVKKFEQNAESIHHEGEKKS